MRLTVFARCALIAASALLASCAGGSSAPTPLGFQPIQSHAGKHATRCPCLYVSNLANNSVTVYASDATGNAAPIRTIAGSNTGLNTPFDVAVDAGGNTYVTNGYGSGSVTVYAAGATGNAAPMQTITGSNTGLRGPNGIALDPVTGDIYVTNVSGGSSNTGSVTIYAPGASGNVAPIATIDGPKTKLNAPHGLTLDANSNIYVPNNDDKSVTVYSAGTTGNTAPMWTIKGRNTKLKGPEQVALDSSSNVHVVNNGHFPGSVTVYAAGANGNVPPLQYIAGSSAKLYYPSGISVDESGNTYVAAYNRINIYAAGATGNVAPANTIKGKRTALDDPQGIAIR